MISETAKKILKEGRIRVKVKRAGMLQFQVFEVKRIKIGNSYFAELFVDRLINLDELTRIANEFGLPVEAENGRAFPKGKGANDFIGL
ncbi:hypothetical protein M1614_03825 [Candidatus Marsarchaeota archaeon]|jgi:hypothetical protein|nr:hypothetical protein [Candidatus Marsarchaeota archaeon]MCL5089866.1 hypothetical protein [Candidatus Marsarchaeota archaeon]